jgi:uncharacterized protein (DUF1499 family)
MGLASLIVGVGLLTLSVAAAWVRFAPSDPGQWHVDPATVTLRNPQNSHLVADTPSADVPALRLALPAGEAAERLSAIILATPRTLRLAGDDGFATYVTRSALWGFPDYTSVRVVADGQGSRISVFGRARFGTGDLGANRARVTGWLHGLEAAALASPS